MTRLTYRYSTEKVGFGSPTWKCVERDLNNAGVYWFLTDPYDLETIAVMVSLYAAQEFCEIVNEEHEAEFTNCELPNRCLMQRKIMKTKKRRTIVGKKDVRGWAVFEGRMVSVGHRTRRTARAAAKKLGKQQGNYKYVGRCAYDYRYIILDTH